MSADRDRQPVGVAAASSETGRQHGSQRFRRSGLDLGVRHGGPALLAQCRRAARCWGALRRHQQESSRRCAINGEHRLAAKALWPTRRDALSPVAQRVQQQRFARKPWVIDIEQDSSPRRAPQSDGTARSRLVSRPCPSSAPSAAAAWISGVQAAVVRLAVEMQQDEDAIDLDLALSAIDKPIALAASMRRSIVAADHGQRLEGLKQGARTSLGTCLSRCGVTCDSLWRSTCDSRTCDRTCDSHTCDRTHPRLAAPFPGATAYTKRFPRLRPRQRLGEVFIAPHRQPHDARCRSTRRSSPAPACHQASACEPRTPAQTTGCRSR